MAYGMQLTYDEIMDKLDLKYIPSKIISYYPHPSIYKNSNLNKTPEYVSPDNVELTITNDDIRLKSNLNSNQTIDFTKKSFFYTILGFTQPHLRVLGDSRFRSIDSGII